MGSMRMAALALVASAGAMLAGCGQKGALYLPEATGEVITRPMQTPEEPAGEAPPTPQQKKPASPPAEPPVTP